jgi:hypothetical protein
MRVLARSRPFLSVLRAATDAHSDGHLRQAFRSRSAAEAARSEDAVSFK